MKSHVYEIVDSTSKLNDPVGRVWWNGKKIESDDPELLYQLKHTTIHVGGTFTFEDGPEFLSKLPYHFKNGYLTARKVG